MLMIEQRDEHLLLLNLSMSLYFVLFYRIIIQVMVMLYWY